MRIISLDPSLRGLGLFYQEDGEINSDVIARTEKDRLDVLGRLCLKFAREAALGWDLLIIENYAFSAGEEYIDRFGNKKKRSASTTTQAEVGGLIRGIFRARKVPIIEVPIGTWQSVTKTTIKKGNAMATSDYLNDIVRKFGIRFKTEHEGDAFLLYETVRLSGIRTWKSGSGPANIKAKLEDLRIDTSKWPTSYGKVEEKDKV